MKKKYIASFVLAALLSAGCSSSFLDQDPPLYIGEEDIYISAERMEATLLGLYGSLKNTDEESFMGGKTYLVFDQRGEDISNVSGNLSTLYEAYTMNVSPVSTENTTTWTNAYATINNINLFLEGIEGGKEVLGNKYAQFKAEAQFIRALCYYYLNNLYAQPYLLKPDAKSVPLRLTAQKGGEGNAMPRSTVEQVYNQVLADLQDLQALPDGTATEAGTTRATKGAAHMLKMRVNMALGNWEAAIKEGESVKGYELVSDVTTLFKTPYYTTETIFSLPMATNNTPNTQQGLAEYYTDPKILKIDLENGIMAEANYSLADDKRMSFKTEDETLAKFTDVRTKLDWVPIFRYAETLLNLAECYANTSDGEAQAKDYLKQVRHRSLAADKDKLNIDALSGDALKQAIYKERRLEFIGEGLRGIDILRRGENFVRGKKVTSPQSSGYIWPIPQAESLLNPDINK